jgi:hypothetical protein
VESSNGRLLAGTSSSARPDAADIEGGLRRHDPPRPPLPTSDFRLLRDLEGIIDFDAEVPHGRLKLGVPEEQLHGAQVLGTPIDQRRLRPPHRVRPVVGAVKTQLVDPVPEDPGVLPSAEMRGVVEPAGKQEVFLLQSGKLDPRLNGLPGGRRDFELHWALRLVLDDDGARRHLVAMAHVSDFEADQVASAQLAVDAEVEQRQFAHPAFHLQSDAQGPDVLELEGRLLPDELALVPRPAMSGVACGTHDGLPSS